MIGIELLKDRGTRTGYATAERMGMQVTYEARKRGVILRPLGNVIILMPPLCLNQAQCTILCSVTRDAIISATT